MLSENILWVGQITLEGERLTADDIVLNRDAVIGARLDKPGIRVSFLLVVLLLIAAVVLCATLLLQTLQFFDPDYTRFALSLVPVIALGWASYQLRPRNHLTVMISDGSALLLASSDGNFLSMCLEAFERLWADKSRMRASLYLHAAHRSVDFGPSGDLALAASGSDVNDPLPPMPELPMFDDSEDEPTAEVDEIDEVGAPDPKDVTVEDVLPPLPPPPTEEPEVDSAPEIVSPPPLPPVAQAAERPAAEPELTIAELLGTDETPQDDAPVKEDERIEPQLIEVPAEELIETTVNDDSDRLDAITAGEDMFALAIEPEPEPEPEPESMPVEEELEPAEPEEPVGPVIEAEAFDGIRPKVATLSRLLRDRPDFAELIDAVDLMDKHIESGCQTQSEAEAFAGAITAMRGSLGVYPAALQVVEAVALAGELDRYMDADTPEA